MKVTYRITVEVLLIISLLCYVSSDSAKKDGKEDEVKVEDAKLEYAKGSLCQYCDYCKVNLLDFATTNSYSNVSALCDAS